MGAVTRLGCGGRRSGGAGKEGPPRAIPLDGGAHIEEHILGNDPGQVVVKRNAVGRPPESGV